MKLTTAQEHALKKFYEKGNEQGGWFSAYDLGVSLSTLQALTRKKLLRSKSGLGSMFSPRTHIEFRLSNQLLRTLSEFIGDERLPACENSTVSATNGAGRVSHGDDLQNTLTAQHSGKLDRCKILGHEMMTGAHGRVTCVVCGKRFA